MLVNPALLRRFGQFPGNNDVESDVSWTRKSGSISQKQDSYSLREIFNHVTVQALKHRYLIHFSLGGSSILSATFSSARANATRSRRSNSVPA